MSNQHNSNMNLKFCEYCMNIMDIHSTKDTLKLVCSIPCNQSITASKLNDYEQEQIDPILLSSRLIDNFDTQNAPNINTIYDPSLLRVFKQCNTCSKKTLFVLHKSHDGKLDNDLICVECKNKIKTR